MFGLTCAGLPTAQTLSTNTGGRQFRVGKMAYSPTANLILAANNANGRRSPPLVNASTGAIVHGDIQSPNATNNDGLEQSVWNPNTNSFFVSVPAIAGAAPGGVAEISTSGTVMHVYYNLDGLSAGSITGCSPAGLALGGSGRLMIGCNHYAPAAVSQGSPQSLR